MAFVTLYFEQINPIWVLCELSTFTDFNNYHCTCLLLFLQISKLIFTSKINLTIAFCNLTVLILVNAIHG